MIILDLETERFIAHTLNQIRKFAPTIKIVILHSLDDQDRTHDAFVVGVDGIILKVQPPAVMLAVIDTLQVSTQPQAHRKRDGQVRMALKPMMINAVTPPMMCPDVLTTRERKIIQLVAQDLSNKDIAYKLSISDSTIRHHMTSIFDKVGVTNRQKLLIHTHQAHIT